MYNDEEDWSGLKLHRSLIIYWTEMDLILAKKYSTALSISRNSNGIPDFYRGICARWAEKYACFDLMKYHGFKNVKDANMEQCLQSDWKRALPHFDATAEHYNKTYYFDVKSMTNPNDGMFKGNLQKLEKDEHILFIRLQSAKIYEDSIFFRGIYNTVGFLLYEDILKLNELKMNGIPGYFFFNGKIEDLIKYKETTDYLEAPLLMMRASNNTPLTLEELEKITKFVNVSKNKDGKIFLENLLNLKFKKAA